MKHLLLALTIIGIAAFVMACRPAEVPSRGKLSAEATRGLSVYESRCLRCHKVDGVGGARGGDLSHISLKRDAAWLTRFLTNPQDVDPGNKMPTVFLRPDELEDIVKYLKTLD